LQTFGLLGIFIGPTIVAVGKAMLDEWLTTKAGSLRPMAVHVP
jgi:predicted PurR-regulated permease PerM